MYTIGEFSKINFVTTKALRHYDEIGLLRPAEIDRFTGYRYYSSAQFPQMSRILSLKQMGFSLAEISALLEETVSAEQAHRMLEEKHAEILRSISGEQARLRMVESFLNMEKGDFMNNYTATVKSLPEVTVASLRKTIDGYGDLFSLSKDVFFPAMKEMGLKRVPSGLCFNIYHYEEYRDTDIDVEVCEAVSEPFAGSGLIQCRVFPPVQNAVSVFHKGSYSDLRGAYTFAFSWMEQNGWKLCAEPRESFLDGVWNGKPESEWLTELLFPVEKI